MKNEIRVVRYDQELQVEAYRFCGIMQKFPNHFHDHYVIGYIESGARFLSCCNKEYQVSPGDLLLFNPGDNHKCNAIKNSPLDYRCLNIPIDVMRLFSSEITRGSSLPHFSPSVVPQYNKIILLHQIHEMILQEQPCLQKEEAFLLFIEQLIFDFATKNSDLFSSIQEDPLEKVCQWMTIHFAENISLNDLSQIAKQNKYTLLRSFTRQKGITPYRYLTTLRINHAKKWLEEGVKPLEAGLNAGFSDQSHFTNIFKELIGLTPKQYQNIFTTSKKSEENP